MENKNCFHCGQPVLKAGEVLYDGKSFCCNGCKTVYEIFNASGLSAYYDMQASPGATPIENRHKYDFLDNAAIVAKLFEFNEGTTAVVTLYIPHIHCSSCIWILENLHKLHPGIIKAQVDFPKKRVRITFSTEETTIKDIVLMLCRIGYEPYISLEDYTSEKRKRDYTPLIKLGVAFFSFGNIMLLSFPEYFEVGEFWLDQYKGFFRLLIFLLAMPSFLYAASGYYVAAWKSVRTGFLSIEVPIALGIIVMFVRSVADMLLNHGPGFFDSMTGLIFFMLLGKAFQSRSYAFLNFERDYKSYFPVAVSRLKPGGAEESVPVYEIGKGDRLLVRNQEIIPCDGILISPHAMIDYSFVTGESQPVPKVSGDHIFAGGRQRGAVIEMEALQPVSQSYLTQLWSNEVFSKKNERPLSSLTNRASRYFTPLLLVTALAGFGYWMLVDMGIAFNVFTAVLIVACPCALALSAPFTLGNIIRILGRSKCYLKDASVVEDMAAVDTIVFDKTGTLTVRAAKISYQGSELPGPEMLWLRSALRPSNHPLSRSLFEWLPDDAVLHPESFSEIPGKGIEAVVDGHIVRVGSAAFTGGQASPGTCVHVAIDGRHMGCFAFANRYREGLPELMAQLGKRYRLAVLSGDNDGERPQLQQIFPPGTQFHFDQKPQDKLAFIRELQQNGSRVAMIGDGLNDAGALAQSDVGVSVAEDINIFSPACDAILDAAAFGKLARFFRLSKMAMIIIRLSFGISILYNFGGLAFALTAKLDPIVAAVAMPLSTVTIVAFVTVAGNVAAWISGVSSVNKKEKSPSRDDMTNVIFSPGAAA